MLEFIKAHPVAKGMQAPAANDPRFLEGGCPAQRPWNGGQVQPRLARGPRLALQGGAGLGLARAAWPHLLQGRRRAACTVGSSSVLQHATFPDGCADHMGS